MKYEISKENAAEIKEYRKSVKEKYLDRRLHALQFLGEGVKPKGIAEKLDKVIDRLCKVIRSLSKDTIISIIGRNWILYCI